MNFKEYVAFIADKNIYFQKLKLYFKLLKKNNNV